MRVFSLNASYSYFNEIPVKCPQWERKLHFYGNRAKYFGTSAVTTTPSRQSPKKLVKKVKEVYVPHVINVQLNYSNNIYTNDITQAGLLTKSDLHETL